MSFREFKRADRVSIQIQREINALLINGLKDPRLYGTNVTSIKMTDDLKHARIFYSIQGNETRQEEVDTAFRKASGFIKRELSSKLNLRYLPELSFCYDDTLDYAMKMENIFSKIKKEDPEKIIDE